MSNELINFLNLFYEIFPRIANILLSVLIILIVFKFGIKKEGSLQQVFYLLVCGIFYMITYYFFTDSVKGIATEDSLIKMIPDMIGPLITAAIALYVLMRTFEVEEQRIFIKTRTTADFNFFIDDIDLSKNGCFYKGAILVKSTNYKSLLQYEDAKGLHIMHSVIKNIGINPMYDLEINFYNNLNDKESISDLEYRQRYLKDGGIIILPMVIELGNGELSNASPAKIELKFTTGLFGKCEEINLILKYKKEEYKDKPLCDIETNIRIIEKNKNTVVYDAPNIKYI